MDGARWRKITPRAHTHTHTQTPHCYQTHGGREEREREKNVSFPPPHLSPGGAADRLPLWKHYSLTAAWQEFITAQRHS